jgi:hypothetical protein
MKRGNRVKSGLNDMSASLSARLDPRVLRALEDTALPYSLEPGSKHIKMRLGGQFVGVFPMGGYKQNGCGDRKLVAQIKRAARALISGQNPGRTG